MPEIAKKITKTPILAFKVIQGHWIRWQSRASVRLPISDNSNLSPISHRYWDTATYWLNIAIFPKRSYLAPSFGMTPFEFMEKLYDSWNESLPAADGEDFVT